MVKENYKLRNVFNRMSSAFGDKSNASTSQGSKMRSLLIAFTLLVGVTAIAALNQSDIEILNVALNLEYLEAEFYSFAVYGRGLSRALRGGGPASTGGKKALLSPQAYKLAELIAIDEINHVRAIRSALGSKAVPIPQINIGSAFAAAADAAAGLKLSPPFDPYGSDVLFYHAAFLLEDVGVTAYQGAIPFFIDPLVAYYATGILATEAYHAGAIRDRLLAISDEYVFPYGFPVKTIVGAISGLRAKLGGGKDGGLEKLVPADSNSIVYGRNITEVLNLVYGSPRPGSFFPRGLNGRYK